jgi:hypothetical protein
LSCCAGKKVAIIAIIVIMLAVAIIIAAVLTKIVTEELITCFHFRIARLRMAGSSLERSLSLHDVSDWSSSL